MTVKWWHCTLWILIVQTRGTGYTKAHDPFTAMLVKYFIMIVLLC